MRKTLLYSVCTILFLVSCKGGKSVDDLELVENTINEEFFEVDVQLIIKKDNHLSLYYTEDGTIDFATYPPVQVEAGGNDNVQTVTFQIEEDILPTQFRLDFGNNYTLEDEIVLKKIIFKHQGKTFEFEGEQIDAFFRADESKCTFDAHTGIIKPKEKDGEIHPSLYPHEVPLGEFLKTFI